ncbi:MAG TPA: sugar phosphate isomerase/epimerase [Firmicutes bacterium]|nr:sugar phosphate isomerase/epimerase [Bacillota bacterium]
MKLAMCNELFGALDWPAVCRSIASHGYEGVEIAPFTFAPYVTAIGPKERREIKTVAEEAGLTITGLHWLLARTEGLHITSPDPAVRQRTAAYLIELVQFCRDLGGRVLVLGSPKQRSLLPGVAREAAMDYAAAVLAEAARAAAASGAVIALEPLTPAETDFICTAGEAMELIKRINSPGLRLHVDAKASTAESCPIGEVIAAYADYIAYVHVNDPNMLGPGMGDMDLTPLITALRTIGYDGWLSVEAFRTGPGGVEEIMAKSRAYLLNLISLVDE